jgi:hypothetical protein|tara:strand:+ start:599 stop:748 length:150 start_codon:yes stop_codon:yes gene_type:complete
MLDLLTNNWQVVTIVILVIDKVVALSPSKQDDLIWSSLKGLIYKLTGKK